MVRLLIVNFANETRQILKRQVVTSELINPAYLVKKMMTALEGLGVVDERPATSRENNEPLRFSHALPSDTPEVETKGSMNTLKLDFLSSTGQRAVRQMIFKHRSMWNGQLVQINTVQHRIAIQPGSKP